MYFNVKLIIKFCISKTVQFFSILVNKIPRSKKAICWVICDLCKLNPLSYEN